MSVRWKSPPTIDQITSIPSPGSHPRKFARDGSSFNGPGVVDTKGQHIFTTSGSHWAKWLLTLLGILSVTYTLSGLACLAWNMGTSYPIDLRLRWIEERLVWEGTNPQVSGHPDPELSEVHQGMKILGGSYPPWAYSTGLILVPPMPWRLVRWYAVLANSLALGVLGWWSYQQARRFGNTWAWVSVCSALAMFPTAICLSYGQYGVIIAGCLAVAEWLLQKRSIRSDLFAGVALGVACVKPQLGGLFVLAVLLEGRWLSVTTCFAYLAAASGFTWLLTGADPVTMLGVSLREASAFSFLSHNPLVHAVRNRFGFQLATSILSLGGLAAGSVLLMLSRSYPRLVRWSLCAVISMFWGYRKHYDIPLLVFPLIGLLVAALERRQVIWWMSFGSLGLTVWMPIRNAQWNLPVVQWIDLVVWVAGAGMLLYWGQGKAADLATGHRVLAGS
jgi:Glycosyltransferase family 87